MEFARVGTTTKTLTAEEFSARADRDSIAMSLVCYGCGADAVFRRRAVNGKRANFGAHHLVPDCPYRSSGGDGTVVRALPTRAPTRPAEGIVRVLPARRAAATRGHQVEHDPDAPPAEPGSRARHTDASRPARETTPARGLRGVLQDLINDVPYRSSRELLELPGKSGSITTIVRNACARSLTAGDEEYEKRRQRLY